MSKKNQTLLYISVALLTSFIIWTVLLRFVDVIDVGPNGSCVGFAHLNSFVHDHIGVNMLLYTVTDWLGLVPVAFCLGFATLGLVQLIKRKGLFKVDKDILVLGIYYTVVIAVYVLFEEVVINYRPVLIDGYLEVSYPSSTTLLVCCIMPTALVQLNARIKNKLLRLITTALITVFTVFMVVGRLISGVHWLSDIIGGALLSASLVCLYCLFYRLLNKR